MTIMFTGLIEKTGTLARLDPRGYGTRLVVEHSEWDVPLATGESIAVNGVCLTVAETTRGRFVCDVLHETMKKTNLGFRRTGSRLNLERAMRVGDRFGGHLVSGHVDGVGTVLSVEARGGDHELELTAASDLLAEIVVKGSIACDGVSLTVCALTTMSFIVNIIPLTWERTSLSLLREGELVNLETDMIGKYVRSSLPTISQEKHGPTLAGLRNAGFAT